MGKTRSNYNRGLKQRAGLKTYKAVQLPEGQEPIAPANREARRALATLERLRGKGSATDPS